LITVYKFKSSDKFENFIKNDEYKKEIINGKFNIVIWDSIIGFYDNSHKFTKGELIYKSVLQMNKFADELNLTVIIKRLLT